MAKTVKESTGSLKAWAKAALEGVPDVCCYECSSIEFGTMSMGDVRVEVEYNAARVLGRYPARDKDAQAEWCRKHRELHKPAIEAAKAALRKAKVRFKAVDNGRGITKLVLG